MRPSSKKKNLDQWQVDTAQHALEMEVVQEVKVFSGVVRKCRFYSKQCSADMVFNMFLPSDATAEKKAPLLLFLSGLTCNEDNFFHKSGPALQIVAKER